MGGDHTLRFLAAFIIFFTFAVVGVAVWLPQNQAIYTLFAGNVGGFAGAALMYLRIKPPDPPAGGAPA